MESVFHTHTKSGGVTLRLFRYYCQWIECRGLHFYTELWIPHQF